MDSLPLDAQGFLEDADPSSPSQSVSTPKLGISDSPAADGQPQRVLSPQTFFLLPSLPPFASTCFTMLPPSEQRLIPPPSQSHLPLDPDAQGARPRRLSNSDPSPFPFEASPLKVSAKETPSMLRVGSSSDLTNEMRRISLAHPSPTESPTLRDMSFQNPELSPSAQQAQQPPIPVSSPVKQNDDGMLVSPFANTSTEDLPPWASPARKTPPAQAPTGPSADVEDSAYQLSRRRSSHTGNSDFLRDIFRLGCHQQLPDYVMRDVDAMRDRDDSPINYASVKEASGELCQALNILSKTGDAPRCSRGSAKKSKSLSTDGNGNTPPIMLNVVPRQMSPSEDWANNGIRMLNRAPSAYGGGDEDMVAIEASSPHTPHSPDPALIIQGTPWGGDCPPTPAQQR